MAARTAFSALHGRVQRRVGDTSATTLVKIKEAINDVAREIWYQKYWSWRKKTAATLAMTAGTAKYTVVTGAEAVRTVFYTSTGDKLGFKDLNIFRADHPKDTDGGTPEEWTVIEESSDKIQIQLWPVPDSAWVGNNANLYYDYHLHFTDMVGDTTTGLPINFDQPIVDRAAEIILEDLGNVEPNLLMAKEQRFAKRLNDLKDTDRPGRGGAPVFGVDPDLQNRRSRRTSYK